MIGFHSKKVPTLAGVHYYSQGMAKTRAPIADDYPRLLRWLPDAEALYLFAGPSIAWPPTLEQFEEIATRPGLTAWMVAEEHNQPAWGHFDLTLQERSARLGRVIIDPHSRGRGLGHTLICLALDEARHLGAEEVRLAVITGNTPAVNTYRRAGFREIVDPERPQFTAMAYDLRERV